VSGNTQSQLAAELGVSRGRISQLITAQEGLSANLIAKLMQLTRLPFDRLFLIKEKPASRIRNGANGHKTKKKGVKPEHPAYVAPINKEGGELRHEVIAKS
jgi:transcriptional regulator with XRE-family HTH domain